MWCAAPACRPGPSRPTAPAGPRRPAPAYCAARSSASASATFARMPARSVSRPVQTPFVALLMEVSWLFIVLIASSCSFTPASALPMARRVDLDLAVVERGQGEDPGQPDGRCEEGRLRSLRVDDAVDVTAH